MTIRDILDLFVDESCVLVRVYDFFGNGGGTGEQVFEGYGNDVPEQYEYCDVVSIDNLEKDGIICFNIDTTEY